MSRPALYLAFGPRGSRVSGRQKYRARSVPLCPITSELATVPPDTLKPSSFSTRMKSRATVSQAERVGRVRPLGLTAQEQADLVEFMKALTGVIDPDIGRPPVLSN